VDFATLGDLKIVERPTVYTVAPHGFQSIKATIKVSSTETGVIFGSILWDGPDLSEQAVILSDIHVDIMDYIKPAYCTEAQARFLAVAPAFDPSTLTEYFPCVVPQYVDRVRVGEPCQRVDEDVVREFAPTIYISSSYFFASVPREYLKHIMKSTNMSCLTPEGAMAGDSDFLSANMYARSLFGTHFLSSVVLGGEVLIVSLGEDALANLSIERLESGTITGHVRIRSKTQGIALSLGDKITMGMNIVPHFTTISLSNRPSAKRQQDSCEALDTLHYFRRLRGLPNKASL